MDTPLPLASPAVRRGLLPEAMTDADLAVALNVTPSAARRIRLREGLPFARVGRRAITRREAFLAWLAAKETVAAPRPGPPPIPVAPAWARDLLRRGRRPGLDADAARGGRGRS